MFIIQNQKKWSTLIIMLIAAMLLIPGTAGAFGGKNHHGKGDGMKNKADFGCHIWRNQNLVKDLGLSDEQVNKLKDMDYAHREKQMAVTSQIDALQLQMDKAMSYDTVEDGTVRNLAKKISSLRGEKYVQKVESGLATRKILTSDQIKKLDQYRMNHKRKGQGQGYGKGMGPGYEDCPMNQAHRNSGRSME